LPVDLHNIVVGTAAHRTNVAPLCALNAGCHVPTRDESGISVSTVADFASLVLLFGRLFRFFVVYLHFL
jgi:hypothetical protein